MQVRRVTNGDLSSVGPCGRGSPARCGHPARWLGIMCSSPPGSAYRWSAEVPDLHRRLPARKRQGQEEVRVRHQVAGDFDPFVDSRAGHRRSASPTRPRPGSPASAGGGPRRPTSAGELEAHSSGRRVRTSWRARFPRTSIVLGEPSPHLELDPSERGPTRVLVLRGAFRIDHGGPDQIPDLSHVHGKTGPEGPAPRPFRDEFPAAITLRLDFRVGDLLRSPRSHRGFPRSWGP